MYRVFGLIFFIFVLLVWYPDTFGRSIESSEYSALLEKCMQEFQATHYETAIKTAKEILAKNDKSVVGRICLASSLDELGKKDEAIKIFKEAESLAEENDHLITILNRLGSLFLETNDLQSSLHYNQLYLNLAKATGNKDHEATALSRIGEVFERQNKLNESLIYYKRAIDFCVDSSSKAYIYNNIANVYLRMNNVDEAIRYYSAVLQMEKSGLNQSSIIEALLNLGNAYRIKKDYKKAEGAIREGMERTKGADNPFWEAMGHRYTAWLYLDLKKKENALLHLQVSKDIFEANGYLEQAADVEREIREHKTRAY